MKLLDIILQFIPEFKPEEAKIHLACNSGYSEPLDVYIAGNFDEWQRKQSKRNFGRNAVISLITIPSTNNWLFAGIHHSVKNGEFKEPLWDEDKKYWYYYLEEDPRMSELNGRLVVSYTRTSRQCYLLAENLIDMITLSEIYPKKLSIGRFPGYKNISLTKEQLDIVVQNSVDSWKTALSSVAGVYLITDKHTGKLYVGSATGEGGIWQRWKDYSMNGHGGNVELKKMVNSEGYVRTSHFSYSVLEIADTHTSTDEILKREEHWKRILMTREYGLNAN